MLQPVDANFVKSILPKNFKGVIDPTQEWVQIHIGKSGDACFKVKVSAGSEAFLKCHAGLTSDYFTSEVDAFRWLAPFVPVPNILATGKDKNYQFLLSSALPGKDLSEVVGSLASEEIVRICAEAMRKLHQIPIVGCPFDQRNDVKIKTAKERASQGLVALEDLDEKRAGWSLEMLIAELNQNIPSHEDLVFTHGDFCLPNILVDKNELSGFIDLGRCGVADRYQDIALCLRSLKFNTDADNKAEFLKHYGLITDLDESKVSFYETLDEFF